MWGLTKFVVEGEKAKDVYDLLCRAKQECGREECGYRSEVICVGNRQYRFAFGMDQVVKYEIEDDLYPLGNIEFEFADSVLKVSEDTYGDDGALLPFLTEYLGKEYEGLFYHISCEADYIGETNDKEGKYFNLEDYDY